MTQNIYEEYPVPRFARNIGETFWQFFTAHSGQDVILPDGRSDIICRFRFHHNGEISEVTPILTGPALQAYVKYHAPGEGWLGIRLLPKSAGLVWKSDLSSAQNRVLTGRAQVAQYLPLMADLPQRFLHITQLRAFMEQVLRQIAVAASGVQNAKRTLFVGQSSAEPDLLPFGNNLKLSPRQIRRLFHAHIGLSPKDYRLVLQFHYALWLIEKCKISLSDAAQTAGYADQSHMTRQFRRFGGFSPARRPRSLCLPGFARGAERLLQEI